MSKNSQVVRQLNLFHDLPPTFILTDIIGASAVIRRAPTQLCMVDGIASNIESITINPT